MTTPPEPLVHDPVLVGLAWHDVTCQQGPTCPARDLHAAEQPLAHSGWLARFLERLHTLETQP